MKTSAKDRFSNVIAWVGSLEGTGEGDKDLSYLWLLGRYIREGF